MHNLSLPIYINVGPPSPINWQIRNLIFKFFFFCFIQEEEEICIRPISVQNICCFLYFPPFCKPSSCLSKRAIWPVWAGCIISTLWTICRRWAELLRRRRRPLRNRIISAGRRLACTREKESGRAANAHLHLLLRLLHRRHHRLLKKKRRKSTTKHSATSNRPILTLRSSAWPWRPTSTRWPFPPSTSGSKRTSSTTATPTPAGR